MGEPLFGGVGVGLATRGSLASDPQIHDLSHANPQKSAFRFPRQLRRYGGGASNDMRDCFRRYFKWLDG